MSDTSPDVGELELSPVGHPPFIFQHMRNRIIIPEQRRKSIK